MKIMDRITDGDGGWFEVDRTAATHVPVMTDVTGIVSVEIQGRIDGESPAAVLKTGVAADEVAVIAWMPQMRAVVSGVGVSESARVWVGADGRRVTAASL